MAGNTLVDMRGRRSRYRITSTSFVYYYPDPPTGFHQIQAARIEYIDWNVDLLEILVLK